MSGLFGGAQGVFEEREVSSNGGGSSGLVWLFVGLLGLVSFPALLMAGVFYVVFFRVCRWRPSFSVPVLLSIFGVFCLLGWLVQSWFGFGWLGFYVLVCVCVSPLFASGWILYRCWLLRSNPELTALKGWAYKFEFKPSPVFRWRVSRLVETCRRGELAFREAAPLGVLDEPVRLDDGSVEERVEPVFSYYDEAFRTRIITGLTGSGKTITMMGLMLNDIRAGLPICVIDFKRGMDIAYFLSKIAKEQGREFYHFTGGDVGAYSNPFCPVQASYDPLASGSATSKADMVLNLRRWDEASNVYKTRTQMVLQSVFFLIDRVQKMGAEAELSCLSWDRGGFGVLADALKSPNLYELISWFKRELGRGSFPASDVSRLRELEDFYKELTSSSRNIFKEQIDGLSVICKTLSMSSYGAWLTRENTSRHIDLFKCATSGDAPIVLFQFNPNEEQEFAGYIGSIILADLARVSALKQQAGNVQPFGVYIDEFQALDPDSVAGLAEKARSARFFTTLSIQSANQVVKAASGNAEATLLALFDTVNTFIIHAGATENTALELSKIIGKCKRTVYSVAGRRASGWLSFNFGNSRLSLVSSREEYDYRVLPSEFQELSAPNSGNGFKAQAFYITKSTADPAYSGFSFPLARKVWLVPDERVLEKVPQSFVDAMNSGSGSKRPAASSGLADGVLGVSDLDCGVSDPGRVDDGGFVLERVEPVVEERGVDRQPVVTSFAKMTAGKRGKGRSGGRSGLPSLDDI